MKGRPALKYEILISKEKLAEYINGYLQLMALEQGGVDNWSWCGDSIRDFLNRHEADDFDELVEKEIKKYEVMV